MSVRMVAIAVGLLTVGYAREGYAVKIALFPGLDKLIARADVIAVVRIAAHVDTRSRPHLHTIHDCYVYQTLKGSLRAGAEVRMSLMDTRTEFVTPYALNSTHLLFLHQLPAAKKGKERYRILHVQGANVELSPFGQEKPPAGKTVLRQVRNLIRSAIGYSVAKGKRDRAALRQLIAAQNHTTGTKSK